MMLKKTCGHKQQSFEQSLISLGGWLREFDAQWLARISGDRYWTLPHFEVEQIAPSLAFSRSEFDIPEWTYQSATQPQPSLGSGRWYQVFKQSWQSWQGGRQANWRASLLGLYDDPSLFSAAALRQPSERAIAVAKPRPLFSSANQVSQIWATSYQLSAALAVVFPMAAYMVQTSTLPTPTAQITDWTFLEEAEPFRLTQPQPQAVAQPKAVAQTKLAIASPAQAPLKAIAKPSKPTGKIANIQSYVLPAKGDFTSGFGMRWGRLHRGIDIAGPVGTPILAAAAGKVITAGFGNDGFGYKVEIKHPDGTVTLYAHNSKILTKVGATVRQGEPIAEMGSSGFSTGPHLHFQIHPRGKEAVDPMFFFGNKLKMAKAS